MVELNFCIEMSSERFEYAEDELEGVLERLAAALTLLGKQS